MGHHFLAIHYKYGQYRFAVISETPSNILCVFYVVSYYIKWITTSWTYSTFYKKKNMPNCLFRFV